MFLYGMKLMSEGIQKAAGDGFQRILSGMTRNRVFGVLTVNTVDQALARAQPGESNKGREAVLAAVEVASLLGKL